MCLSKDKSIHGIRIRSSNVFLMVIAIILCCLVLVSALNIKSDYEKMIVAMNDYSECSKAVNELQNASDFLSNQVRQFAVNHDPIYVENYFYEADFLHRREKALTIVELSHVDDATDTNLKMALKEAQYLERRERYSMKLICEAIGLGQDILSQIITVEISPEDKALSNEKKLERATSMLFDSEYLACQERIYNYSSKAVSELINSYIEVQLDNDRNIRFSFRFEMIWLLTLIIVSVVTFIILLIFVLNPLEFHIDAILNNRKMDEQGSYELRYIARAYNTLCDKNAVKASLLQHKAEHDPLTGLINRNAFDQIKNALAGAEEPIAYLIIDIDLFKKINDEYGHPIGDEVLKKISNLLMITFRATDYVARIGGDEFAVIMTKFGTSAVEIIQKKIDGLNHTLQSVDDGLPCVSLSVGVAFSDSGYHAELVEQADKALYRVKKGGRCNCSFYKSEE